MVLIKKCLGTHTISAVEEPIKCGGTNCTTRMEDQVISHLHLILSSTNVYIGVLLLLSLREEITKITSFI